MNVIKTANRDEITFLMDFSYDNVKLRLNQILEKDAIIFADVIIKKSEINWLVPDSKEYFPMSGACVEDKDALMNLLNEKLCKIREAISVDKLLGEHVCKLLNYPGEDYVFYALNNGTYNVIITGWGCSLKTKNIADSIENANVEAKTMSEFSDNDVPNKEEVTQSQEDEDSVIINYDSDEKKYLLWYKGRYGRTQYFLTGFASAIIFNIAEYMSRGNTDNIKGYICLLVMILSLWCCICTATKRCHDLGHNGWWQLIPFYGLWLLFASGEEDDNQYGEAE